MTRHFPEFRFLNLLDISDLTKAYAGAKALDYARLDLQAGEVHALMGENGAGKSTLIKILAGAVAADGGTIRIDGEPVGIGNPRDAARLGLRFIHQELSFVPHLSVAENLFLGKPYPKRFGGLIDWPRLNAAARKALAALAIDHLDPAIKMARLSTGNQMLVKIAAAFLDDGGGRARIHIMDEPTAALTDAESERLFDVVGRLKAQGCGVLYVSHRMDEVLRLTDRVTVMRDGRTVSTRPISQTGRQRIIEEMTGRTLSEAYPKRTEPVGDTVVLSVAGLGRGTLADVDFNLRAGEILGIVGLSGAGQSDVLSFLIGARRAAGQRITLRGRTIDNREPADAWRNGLAYVPRERRAEGLIPGASIAANTVLPHLREISRAGLFRAARREAAATRSLAAQVRLKYTHTGQTALQLSGGNQQKVVFARAIGGHPDVLLLDEPTRGVDVGAKFDIYQLLRDLAAGGMAVIMTSSDLPELIAMTDRLMIMRGGRMCALFDTGAISQNQLLAECYGHDGEIAESLAAVPSLS